MERVLVTGAAGFLGSHLCDHLILQGHSVVGLDNLNTGNLRNLEHLMKSPNFYFVQRDIASRNALDGLGVVHRIYNMACPASPPKYQKDPIFTMKTSVLGALNILDFATQQGATVFQASTSEVYGDPNQHPQTEEYWGHVNCIGLRSCYDEGKRCAETLFFDYWRTKKTKIKVGRIFNTYGPRMDAGDGRVVSNFIVQALKGEDITIYGDGSQTRSFCYVDDLIAGIVRFTESEEGFVGPLNLGNPHEFTVKDLAEKVVAKTGASSKIVYHPLPSDDPKQRRPDISKAKKTLDWIPMIELEAGLDKTIEYFKMILRLT